MKLYILDIRKVRQNSILEEKIFAGLSKQRQEKIERCRHDIDKLRSLCAGALMQLGVMEWEESEEDFTLHKVDPSKVNWTMLGAFFAPEHKALVCDYKQNGKPYFVNYPHIHFNLSHSGNYVIAAFDKNPVGVDIQEHRSISDSLARRFLNDWEVQQVGARTETAHWEEKMCRLWTVKESYIKLTGEGLQKSMKEIRVDMQNATIENRHGEPLATFKEKVQNGKYYISVCQF